MILSLRTLDFWPYFYTHWDCYLILPKISISAYFYKHWNSNLFLANTGILILSFQTMEFWPFFFKLWNYDLIRPNIGILALFYTHWNFDLILRNNGILALSVYTLKFLSYRSKPWNLGLIFMHIYTLAFWPHPWKHCKHLPIILSFHCNSWNSCPILPNINLNSAPIFIHIGILTSSFQTLQFWPYLYTHWSSYVIVLNLWIWALFLGTFTHWHFDLILENIAVLVLSCYTLEFGSHPLKYWTCSLIFINIGILAFFYKHWNSYLIHPQIGISGPIFLQIGIFTSSFRTFELWPYSYKH